jgi:hypothetical protein
MAATVAPIPVFIPAPAIHSINGKACFIESHTGDYFNLNAAYECGVYESFGKWWLWFHVPYSFKYYKECFDNKQDAEKILKILINSQG